MLLTLFKFKAPHMAVTFLVAGHAPGGRKGLVCLKVLGLPPSKAEAAWQQEQLDLQQRGVKRRTSDCGDDQDTHPKACPQ